MAADAADDVAGDFVGGVQHWFVPIGETEIGRRHVFGEHDVAQPRRPGDPQTASDVAVEWQLQVDPLVAAAVRFLRRVAGVGGFEIGRASCRERVYSSV